MTDSSRWDARYATSAYVYGTDPNDFLVSVADRLPVGNALCLAEGEGRNATYLATRGHDVTAVDFSARGLEKALSLAAEKKVTIATRLADLDTFDLGVRRWDVVVSIFCHLPAYVRRRVHRRVVSALHEGGMLVLEAYTPSQLEFGTGGPRAIDLLVTLETLMRELRGLDFVIARELERPIQEGSLHRGRSAVVQVLAVK